MEEAALATGEDGCSIGSATRAPATSSSSLQPSAAERDGGARGARGDVEEGDEAAPRLSPLSSTRNAHSKAVDASANDSPRLFACAWLASSVAELRANARSAFGSIACHAPSEVSA